MANTILRQVKLGTPKEIVGGACPNCDLTVQSLSRLDNLTLHDGEDGSFCTTDGAFKKAVQLLKEDSLSNSFKIDLKGNSSVFSIDDLYVLFEALSKYNLNSNMAGNITVQKTYKEFVDALQARFPELNIIVLIGFIVKFKDPEVLRVLLANGVGSDGSILEKQLAAVTDIKTWFQNNSSIVSFNELSKTGVTNLERNAFSGCINLKEIDFSNIIFMGGHGINNVFKFLYLPKATTVQSFEQSILQFAIIPSDLYDSYKFLDCDMKIIDVGKRTPDSVDAVLWNRRYTMGSVILRWNNCPPLKADNHGLGKQITYLFVLPNKLELFKTDSLWSSVSDKTFAIGGEEWQSAMRSLAEQYAPTYNPDFDIENADYSRAYIDYDIFGVDKSKVPYILFDDPEVERILLANATHADENTITKEEIQTWCISRGIDPTNYMDGTITYSELPSDIK